MQHIPRRRYTDDFKAQAILLVQSLGPAKAARQLDMSVKTLSNWLDEPPRDPRRPFGLSHAACSERLHLPRSDGLRQSDPAQCDICNP